VSAKTKPKKERPGVQVVLRVPAEVKALLKKTAHDLDVSMNAAATERIATGRWPTKKEISK
jgi:hypothetical protein